MVFPFPSNQTFIIKFPLKRFIRHLDSPPRLQNLIVSYRDVDVHLCVMRTYVNALEQAQQRCSRRLRHAFAPLLQFIISIVTTPLVGVTLLRARRRWRRLVNLNYTHKRVHHTT
jgi:hypothetical protein